MGGAVPGGVAGGLTEIFQEGLRLPFIKLYKGGKEDRELFRFIGSNMRIPEKTLEDFRAEAATTMWGVERVKALIDKYGLDVFVQSTRDLQDYSERMMRAAIERMPAGRYVGRDQLDDDGITETRYRTGQLELRETTDRRLCREQPRRWKRQLPLACSKGGATTR
jgi:N-methylhydantoinase B